MEIFELQQTLTGNPAQYVAKLLKGFKPYFKYEAYKHYDVIWHDVLNPVKRQNKMVQRPMVGAEARPDGTIPTEVSIVQVNRIAIPFQKFIVETLATFLTGGQVEWCCTPENDTEQALLDEIRDIWKKNKLSFMNGTIAETMMSQTECAELWFTDYEKDENGKDVAVMKFNLLRPSDGFELQPIYDEINNLIAFGIKYTKDKIQHYDLYTSDELRKHIKENNQWILDQTIDANGNSTPAIIKLPYGKIPIIYFNQLQSEWYDVQTMIERLEKMQSNHGDTNDYTGSPILFVKGSIQGFAAKGEPGKVLQASDKDSSAEYLLPTTAPESMLKEFDNLKAFIHLFSGAPDLSLNSLKGLGQIPTGAAFERLLILTYMKVRRRQIGDWGLAIQRRNNFLIAASVANKPALKAAKKLDITINWGLYQLNDILEKINAAIVANGGQPVIDHEGSIAMAGLTDDPKETFDKIQTEQKSLNNIFDPNPTPPAQ